MAVLTVLRDTANGDELISDWPGFDFVDWILDSFNIMVSLFFALFLGVALGLPFGLGGSTVYLLGTMLCCGLSLALIFPLMLLSALDGGSPHSFVHNLRVGQYPDCARCLDEVFCRVGIDPAVAGGDLAAAIFSEHDRQLLRGDRGRNHRSALVSSDRPNLSGQAKTK